MKNRVHYEWAIEESDEHGDVLDVDHNSIARLLRGYDWPNDQRLDLVLIYNFGNEADGLLDRQWAYVKDGELPDEFDGGAVIPEEKRRQLRRAIARDRSS